MGALHAAEFAAAVEDGSVDLRAALSWHLTANHYPPVPTSMIEPCIKAIEAMQEEDADKEIRLPEGVSWRGKRTAPAWAIVEGHHLGSFV